MRTRKCLEFRFCFHQCFNPYTFLSKSTQCSSFSWIISSRNNSVVKHFFGLVRPVFLFELSEHSFSQWHRRFDFSEKLLKTKVEIITWLLLEQVCIEFRYSVVLQELDSILYQSEIRAPL